MSHGPHPTLPFLQSSLEHHLHWEPLSLPIPSHPSTSSDFCRIHPKEGGPTDTVHQPHHCGRSPFSLLSHRASCHAFHLQFIPNVACTLCCLLHCPWLSRACPSLPVPLFPGLCLKVSVLGSPPLPSPHTDTLTSLPIFHHTQPPLPYYSFIVSVACREVAPGPWQSPSARPGSLLLPCKSHPFF